MGIQNSMGRDTLIMSHKANKSKCEQRKRFKQLHPEGRKEYAKRKKEERKKKIESAKQMMNGIKKHNRK